MKCPLTIREAYQEASSFLAAAGIDSPRFEGELLVRESLGMDRTRFFVELDQPYPTACWKPLQQWLKRRADQEPIQYITGKQEFYGRMFQVNPAVLIPRPETELLIEQVLSEASKWQGKPCRVVDVGTGSGVIAITLALMFPDWEVYAIDLSVDALNMAKQNAHAHGVQERIHWLEGAYLEPLLDSGIAVDMVVSNPPYIPSADVRELKEQVRDYEPELALDGGADGLEAYQEIIRQASQCERPPSLIAFEIGFHQREEVSDLLRQSFPAMEVSAFTDLAGLDRIVIGKQD